MNRPGYYFLGRCVFYQAVLTRLIAGWLIRLRDFSLRSGKASKFHKTRLIGEICAKCTSKRTQQLAKLGKFRCFIKAYFRRGDYRSTVMAIGISSYFPGSVQYVTLKDLYIIKKEPVALVSLHCGRKMAHLALRIAFHRGVQLGVAFGLQFFRFEVCIVSFLW